jgi:hypothetical protein
LPACLIAGAIFAGSMVVPTSPALAQSGSRICGLSTTAMPGIPALGFLTERRQRDTAYRTLCDATIRNAREKINRDPRMKNLQWTEHRKETCESVGKLFQSSNSPQDMCDKMRANEDYMIQKLTNNTTVYDRLTDTT